MPTMEHCILNLPQFQLIEWVGSNPIRMRVKFVGEKRCIHCDSQHLRKKDRYFRRIRHADLGSRQCWLEIQTHKLYCQRCRKYFVERLPGIKPYSRSTEAFKKDVCEQHHMGVSQRSLEHKYKLGHATIEKWYQTFLELKEHELWGKHLPRVLGIDEHFFSRKHGYFTTLANLQSRKVFDLVQGRSEKALEGYFKRLKGRERVRIVVMDLSAPYRRLVRRYFPNAKIVADRFHVIRLVSLRFMQLWKSIDPYGSKSRGLISLIRRHSDRLSEEQKVKLQNYFEQNPAVKALYEFKDSLNGILRQTGLSRKSCKDKLQQLLWHLEQMKNSPFELIQSLAQTFESWLEPIARMLRFSRTNSTLEGLHNRIEEIQRRAYGFRNFQNLRIRVLTFCG